MNRKVIAWSALALALLAVGWGGWRWSTAPEQEGDIILLGNVDIRQIALAFQDSERIVEMRAEEGNKVKAGQVLAVLDARTLEHQAAQAQAQVDVYKKTLLRLRNGSRPEEIAQAQARADAADAEAKLAEEDFKRMRAITEETQGRGVSRQDVDRAASAMRAARAKAKDQAQALRLTKLGPRSEDIEQAAAQLKAAEESLALLQHRISLSELKSPSDAIVRSRLAEPGDMASPQRPVYALALVQPKWIRAYVNEVQLARVHPGMAAKVSVDGLAGASLPGEIGYISSVAEFTPKQVQTEELRTSLVYEIRVLVKDPEDRLRLGMPATVRLTF
ncbi:MAG TPA: efflux RND transporter periplasmic adaptor subunit [Accumulibacter sp.]|jgi:HlyD family secretion protein|nr:efflux RND transporter periplasmic adaptor subunit [Accumulibacter sp.]